MWPQNTDTGYHYRERTPEQIKRDLFRQARDARAKAARLRADAVDLDAEAERVQERAEAM